MVKRRNRPAKYASIWVRAAASSDVSSKPLPPQSSRAMPPAASVRVIGP
jgi:hypothetical protein